MSEVRRVSREAEEFVELHRNETEKWIDALDRLLGLEEPPMTEERVVEIVEEKIEEAFRNR